MSPSKKVKRATAGRTKGAKKGIRRKKKEESAPAVKASLVLESKPSPAIGNTVQRILAVLAVIGITVYIYSIRDRVEEFAELGYFGAFLIALIANATVILPAPGVAVVFGMGAVINPAGVGFAAGAGGALGELTGYLAGYGGQAAVENSQTYNRILPWVQKYGAWMILVLSAIPNPFFDLAGIAAGISKIPLWKFLLACWAGVTIKMMIFAFAGAYSIDWIASFYE